MPLLEGMSGGGVWCIELDREDGTVDSVQLVGIGIERQNQASAIIATRIQCVVDLFLAV